MILKKFPHVYVLLFIVILVSALLTYIIPSNKYDLQKKPDGTPTKLIDPKSYHPVDPSPVDPWEMFLAIPKGFQEVASIIFFIFFVVGSFSIVNATGAVSAGIQAAVSALKGRESLVIFVVVILFSIGGATFGMAEEALVFIPMLVPLAIALGYDSLTGIGLALIGPCAGFTAAFLNPFTLGVAQGIVGLPLFSGMEYRIVIYVITVATASVFIYLYARKIKKNPQLSAMYEEDQKREKVTLDLKVNFTLRHKLVLLLVLLTFVLIIYGVNAFGWYIDEIGALFIVMGVICGFVGGMWPSKIAETFVEGATSVTIGALVVGVARAILVVLTQGSILHTIVYALASAVSGLPSFLSVVGMYIVQILISVIIPSGSGMASVTMPIMGPLSTLLGFTQQTAVLIYQFADGFTNIIIPTSGYFLAGLAMGKVPYEKFVKWYLPLFLIFLAEGAVFSIIAQLINFGPF
ncbi:MAG TPA: AbgT family transporter [Anaerolineaceae bacterium]